MRKIILSFSLLLTSVSLIIFSTSCNKVCPTPPMEEVCDVRGTYSGTFQDQYGSTGIFTYNLKDNNFTDGSANIKDPLNAYGSYTNTCDSLFISAFNTINNDYYYFKGAFSVTKDTVTGIYQNISMPAEIGPFILVKQ